MKEYLSKNWKKVIYIICGICIAFNLFRVVATPAKIPEEFYKYGPEVKYDLIDRGVNATENAEDSASDGVDTLTGMVADSTGYSDSNARMIVIISLLICGVLILSTLIDDGAPAKKK